VREADNLWREYTTLVIKKLTRFVVDLHEISVMSDAPLPGNLLF
jgi:hypothetical protein